MKDNIYCIYDRLSLRYGSVFSSPSDATASRQFYAMFQQSGQPIDDYELCACGTVEIATGIMSFKGTERVPYQDYIHKPIIKAEEKALENKE